MNNNLRLINKAQSTGLLFPLIVFFGFLAGGLVIWQSWLLSEVVTKVFLEDRTLSQVIALLRLILTIVLGRAVFTFINEALSGRLAVRIKNSLRDELLTKINRLGPIFLKGERAGELTTTTLQGLDSLDAYFSQFLPQILLAALLPMTILIVVFPIDLLTGIVFVLTAPLIPLFMILIGKLSENHTKRQWTALSRLGAYFLDTLQGLSTLMVLGRSKDRGKEIRAVSDQYRSVTMNVLKITFLSAFVLEMIATIATALVAVEIGLRLLYSRMEFQQAFFILLIAPEFYLPLRNLSLRYHAGMTGLTAAARIYEILDAPEKTLSEKPTQSIFHPFTSSFETQFKDVSYQYQGRSIAALNGISLSIESGKHYALVGESGSGKSTLAWLLLRYLSPESGIITINGENIDQWDLGTWRSAIGWVPQASKLFNTSLLENIRLMDQGRTRTEVLTALDKAGLTEFLSKLPGGLDTPLLEGGVRLSGGEARRVVLARAFLKDVPFLIMDEPSAHLDFDLEKAMVETTWILQKGRTTLTIAHRLTTVRSADHIFVLKQGHLVEQGTHEELERFGGEYWRLLNSARNAA